MASPGSYGLGPIAITIMCSATGVVANFAFFCMNTTINYITMPVLLLGQPPNNKTQTASKKFVSAAEIPPTAVSHLSRQWAELYNRGRPAGAGLAVAAGLAHGSAAYFAEPSIVKWFFGAAAALSVAVVPYTLIVMLATNDELHRRAAASSKDLEDGKTLGLLSRWVGMNKTRANIALFGACLGALGVFTLVQGSWN